MYFYFIGMTDCGQIASLTVVALYIFWITKISKSRTQMSVFTAIFVVLMVLANYYMFVLYAKDLVSLTVMENVSKKSFYILSLFFLWVGVSSYKDWKALNKGGRAEDCIIRLPSVNVSDADELAAGQKVTYFVKAGVGVIFKIFISLFLCLWSAILILASPKNELLLIFSGSQVAMGSVAGLMRSYLVYCLGVLFPVILILGLMLWKPSFLLLEEKNERGYTYYKIIFAGLYLAMGSALLVISIIRGINI